MTTLTARPETMPTATEAGRQLDAVCAFLREWGAPHFYANWDDEHLRAFVYFRAREGTLGWVQTDGLVSGAGFVAQLSECQIRAAVQANHAGLLDWLPSHAAADCLLIGHFACAHRAAFHALLQTFARRWPSWRSLKLYTFRNRAGQHLLRRLSRRAIDRLLRKGAV